jgi:hypothetical protein
VSPRFLIRDRDDKFGTAFDALALATGIRMVRTAERALPMPELARRYDGRGDAVAQITREVRVSASAA